MGRGRSRIAGKKSDGEGNGGIEKSHAVSVFHTFRILRKDGLFQVWLIVLLFHPASLFFGLYLSDAVFGAILAIFASYIELLWDYNFEFPTKHSAVLCGTEKNVPSSGNANPKGQ